MITNILEFKKQNLVMCVNQFQDKRVDYWKEGRYGITLQEDQ